uniref:Uncharacterized protein n=1 Tax=Avena sativa TaxID=4498 RepID=A0ACD5UBS9_AVESA
MATEDAQEEVERRLRDIGARLGSLPGSNKELLSLVEETEIWLSRVDQSPPKSMHDALKPTMDALVEKRLLKHSSQAIKVGVACCLTEVTRISAPEPPYPDDVMRGVFTVVVQSFAKLDDTESPLFAKRVSMLETVAKVRSCVLMLDLDCDDLILDTFNHFFSTISSTHQENVITSMETIMMFVIQESEPVHSDLASCLLRYLKKEKKDSLPASFMLAERIVGLCAEKLKPVFIELLQGTPLNDYSEAVVLLVEGSSDAGTDDEVDAVGEDTVNEDTDASGELSPETKVGNRVADDTSKPVDSTPAVDKPKRGRPSAVKSQEKKPVGKSQGSGLESKEVRSGSTSGGRPARRLAKDVKLSPRKTGEGESSKKQSKGSSNLRKEDTLSDKDEDTDEDLSLKEMASPKSMTKTGKTKGQPGNSGVSKRKLEPEVEEVPQSKKNKVLDESLVGSRIKVWWPDDKKFYNGVVKSFKASSKKHKVVYDDGDIEQLELEKEKWDFIAEEQDMNSNATSDM